jgi:aconitase B
LDAKVYLSGAEVAAASAVKGRIATADEVIDINLLDMVKEPDSYLLDDAMMVFPEKDGEI